MKQELAMKNRDIYQRDPSTRKLENEGVASVNDDLTSKSMTVLRYELETFVCEGQYKKGLEDILDTYLKNVDRDKAEQRAVWVSGFFGSGKSHLVKMLRAIWLDSKFDDGATARGLADLPESVRAYLKELSIQGKKQGGLHAASGTLGAAASGSVRLALLRIVFKSVGLPENYPVARFVMWLKSEGILEKIRELVARAGYDWHEELDNFYVAEGLHGALVECKPNLFSSSATCVETLNNLYPFVADVSNDDMLKAIKQALSKDGKFPLTLIVLDEIQQYIGDDSQRSMDVQEAVEACCKNIGGKLLFIGTGQTAISNTTNLKKLEGRFTVRVELSDSDVDVVVRNVILSKKGDAIGPISENMKSNLGEISRHLHGTKLGHRQDDLEYYAQDYPLLPVRRRFWETALRVLDQTGTDGQLRNQLSMVHKAIQSNLDSAIGNVIPADYLFFDSAEKLLQARILPRKVHEKIMSWNKGGSDEQLKARATALVFLINKVAIANTEIGIKATVDTIADLLITDLSAGSSELRSRLPGLLDQRDLLIKVNDEYRIETEESAAWNDEFQHQKSLLENNRSLVDSLRNERIILRLQESVRRLSISHGSSNVSREIKLCTSGNLASDSESNITVWVRDGWSTDENSVRAEARQAGNQSPTIFGFIPQRNPDGLRTQIVEYKAALETLASKTASDGPEGQEARAATETSKLAAETKIKEYLDELFGSARVFQAGGSEITGNNLQDMIVEAAQNSLQRLYSQFAVADHPGWKKVYDLAKQGAPDALRAISFEGDPATNPVCKQILGYIAGGKKGIDIRTHFEGPGCGWSGDAVDGGLQVLLIAGLVRAQDDRGQLSDPKQLERKAIGKLTFKVESATVTASQRIQIRKLLQQAGIPCKTGEELLAVPAFIEKLKELTAQSGGEAPKPANPDMSLIEEIRLTAGNEQLLLIFNRFTELAESIDKWSKLAQAIEPRWKLWVELQGLLEHAGSLKEAEEARIQCLALRDQRLLLTEPNPVVPLLKSVEDALRKQLNASHQKYADVLEEELAQLDGDTSWTELPEADRTAIIERCDLKSKPDPAVGDRQALVLTLKQSPLSAWDDRIHAVANRTANARELAAKTQAPQAKTVDIPKRMLKTQPEIDDWISEVRTKLETALKEGPVIIR